VARLRRYVMAGLLVWLPVAVTVLVFKLLLDLMDGLLFLIPSPYRPEALLGFRIPGLGAILALLVLVLTGILGANLLGKRLVGLYESVLARIPLVRTVYGAVKNFAEVVLSDTESSFKKVLLVEYPESGCYSLAFQTSEDAREVQAVTGEVIVTVFVPTTPNPTSGFMLFVPRSQVIDLDMSVEEAFKMIVSLGVVVPEWHPLHPVSSQVPGGTTAPPPGGAAAQAGISQTGTTVAAAARATASQTEPSKPQASEAEAS
jgi:uncharacterized membrane protein